MIAKKLLDWFVELLACDATTGSEFSSLRHIEKSADLWLLNDSCARFWQRQMVTDERFNLYGCYGVPKLIFCTHVDTVAPYISPIWGCNDLVYGRGSCDAKGQVFTILLTVRRLLELGIRDFAVLLVVGEEQDSCGAKLANTLIKDAENVLVLEPTGNRLISAAKGSLRMKISVEGKSAHSGYPASGEDAIQSWSDLNQCLLQHVWLCDPELGNTTFNWGELHSCNADNVVSAAVSAQLHWRTTFTSHKQLIPWFEQKIPDNIHWELVGRREPFHFKILPGFETDVVAFGCDAPYLSNLGSAMLYGPGDILVAHGPDERISLREIETAVTNLVRMSQQLLN